MATLASAPSPLLPFAYAKGWGFKISRNAEPERRLLLLLAAVGITIVVDVAARTVAIAGFDA